MGILLRQKPNKLNEQKSKTRHVRRFLFVHVSPNCFAPIVGLTTIAS